MKQVKQSYDNIEKVGIDEHGELLQQLYDSDPDNFLLVKVGANDGWMCDNLYDFVIKNDPKAVMIEPIPCYFDALKETYKDLKNISYENVAIDSSRGKREMLYIADEKFQKEKVTFRMSHQPHLLKEHWARGLGSFYDDKNNLGCPELRQHASTIEVETQTPSDILKKYKVNEKTNLVFSTDCEGHDYEILKCFDFETYKPKIYICEIVRFTRYPLSHPRRKEYIDEQQTPEARVPPPSEEGWVPKVALNDQQAQYLQSISEKDPEFANQPVLFWMKTGEVPPARWAYTKEDIPQNKEYLQEDGLYTIEEFKSTIDIFNKAGYLVKDHSFDGDIIAVNVNYLEKNK